MRGEPRERAEAAAGATRPSPADFRIGNRLVCPGLNRIVTRDATLQLEPKVMKVLLRMVDRPGEVVTKEELFRDVWQGTFVTEDVLTRAVGELRRAFQDDAARPRVIETIRKSGYRLIAPIVPELPQPAALPADARIMALRLPRAGVAILTGLALVGLITIGLIASSSRRRSTVGPMRVRPVTTLPGNERDPAVSPDGTRVAFAWNGGSGEDYSLYVQLVDGQAPLRLTREVGVEDRAPAWSPDGKRLAFTRSAHGTCRILLVSAFGGEERPLAPCGDREYRRLAWSPDGKWLAFSRRDNGGPLAVELLSPETLERRRVTQPPAAILGDSSPAFSPDGGTLAFTRNITEGVDDLYRVPVAGGEPKRLTFDNRDTMGSSWSEDGRSLVFSSSRAGIYSLWRVPASGGEPTWVAGGGIKMKHPSMARAKNVVAFENWLYEVNLWRVPARPGGSTLNATLRSSAPPQSTSPRLSTPLRLTDANDEWNYEPAISPDGGRVAFVSTRSGSPEIWVTGRDGGTATKLTSFGGARMETPRWSPDGGRLVFSAGREARADLWVVEAAGGVPDRVTTGPGDAVAPFWSRDGQSIYFASRRSGTWQVWKLRVSDRSAIAVTRDGGYAAKESPDGRALYFTRAGAPGIWRQAAEGGPASRVVAALAPEDWANWEVGADGLYFRELCAEHKEPSVVFLAFGSSQPVHLAPLSEQGWSGFSVAPDGSWLVYPRVDRHTCDIRLIENAP
jgi:Tol biopolymer transport system component/DNA-binding winged helix-turn-helix (wHTH) protein